MDKGFICLNETKKLPNEFTIGYMINPGLNFNKVFREHLENFMHTTFGEMIQPFIKATLAKNSKIVLALIIFRRQEQIILINIIE